MLYGAIGIPIISDTTIYNYAYIDSTFVLLSATIDSLMLQIDYDMYNQSNCVKNIILVIPIFFRINILRAKKYIDISVFSSRGQLPISL